MKERRNQRGGTEEEIHNRIVERAKYATGLKQDRRGSKKMTEAKESNTIWTAEGVTKLGELLIKYDQGSADEFISEFENLNLKNAKGVTYTQEQIRSKYPNVRKLLVKHKVLGEDAKFVGRRGSDIISENDLIAAMQKYKKTNKIK